MTHPMNHAQNEYFVMFGFGNVGAAIADILISYVLSQLYWVCDKIVLGNHEGYLYISHVNH